MTHPLLIDCVCTTLRHPTMLGQRLSHMNIEVITNWKESTVRYSTWAVSVAFFLWSCTELQDEKNSQLYRYRYNFLVKHPDYCIDAPQDIDWNAYRNVQMEFGNELKLYGAKFFRSRESARTDELNLLSMKYTQFTEGTCWTVIGNSHLWI